MTSHDVRDMLNLPGDAGPRPTKKQKLAGPKSTLKGLAREVQNLSGDNPIAIIPEITTFKKKRFGSRKPAAKWDLRAFHNSAREDKNFVLRHWRRKEDAPLPSVEDAMEVENGDGESKKATENSTFAKFNVNVTTPTYDDKQYEQHLKNDDWSKAETDYLMGLAQDFDLRWPIIWDRYEYQAPEPIVEGIVEEGALTIIPPAPKIRTMEDMKARYYSVAAAMLRVHNPVETMVQGEFNLLELMTNFNPIQETTRKKFVEATLNRTKDEAREEENLLLELKRIIARSDRLGEERRDLYARLDAPQATRNIAEYATTAGLQTLLGMLVTQNNAKKGQRKSLADGTSPAGGANGMSQPSFDARRDSNIRESISGPSGMKKGSIAGANERRQLTQQEEEIYGVAHPERITNSGPVFRHERISKSLTSKSSVIQAKMTNILTELGIPPRLRMPTANTGAAYETLLNSLNSLLNLRKEMEKLQMEIATQKKLIEEREKAAIEARNAKAATEGGEASEVPTVKVEDEGREQSAAPSVHKRSASVLSTVSDKSSKRQKK